MGRVAAVFHPPDETRLLWGQFNRVALPRIDFVRSIEHNSAMATQDLARRIMLAALDRFGRYGFDGASTRDIARASGTAMSSITYHFGGKEGLYLACADFVAAQIAAVHEPLHQRVLEAPPRDAEEARAALLALLENFARFMLSPDSEPLARFIVREQQDPTEAFERIYERVMAPVLATAFRLVGMVRPSLDEDGKRVLVMSAIGMALFLRVARACVMRVMGVEAIDAPAAERLVTGLRRSALSLLSEA